MHRQLSTATAWVGNDLKTLLNEEKSQKNASEVLQNFDKNQQKVAYDDPNHKSMLIESNKRCFLNRNWWVIWKPFLIDWAQWNIWLKSENDITFWGRSVPT